MSTDFRTISLCCRIEASCAREVIKTSHKGRYLVEIKIQITTLKSHIYLKKGYKGIEDEFVRQDR